jgi:hypothetical protein
MVRTEIRKESKAPEAKNHIADVKGVSWAYVVTALLYSIAGGPPDFQLLFLMSTFLFALNVFLNSEGAEKKAIVWMLIAFLALAAVALALPSPGRELPAQMAAGMWVVYKVMFVFGLALILPSIIDKWVEHRLGQSLAIFLAFVLQGGLVFFMSYEKEHHKHAHVLCETVVQNVCTPVVQSEPWYTVSTAIEDIVFGLQVGLLLAAFGMSGKKEDPDQTVKG